MNGIQSIKLQLNVGFSEFSGYLTPDALMTYCQTRLQGIDTQVQAAFAEQEQMNKDQSTLSDLLRTLQDPPAPLDLNTQADFETALHAAQQMTDAANKCLDPQTKAKLQAAANVIYAKLSKVVGDKENTTSYAGIIGPNTPDSFVNDVFSNKGGNYGGSIQGDDNKMPIEEFQKDTQDAVKGIQQDITSSGELAMINLQSLMSQRQEAIQLATNLVQSLGDQCNKIAENVGH